MNSGGREYKMISAKTATYVMQTFGQTIIDVIEIGRGQCNGTSRRYVVEVHDDQCKNNNILCKPSVNLSLM